MNPAPPTNHYQRRRLKPLATAKALAQLIFSPQHYRPQQALPQQSPDWTQWQTPQQQAKFIWFGHSSLLIRINNKNLFIDPVFARYASPLPIMAKRFQAPPATLQQLPALDWILITHNHYDHLDRQAIRFFANSDCQFVAPLGLRRWLRNCRISNNRIHEMDWWQSLDLGDCRLQALPALHYSGRGLFDKNRSLCCSYALSNPQERYYFSGDSCYGKGEHFAAIGEAFNGFDLAFIENGQYHSAWRDNHMMPHETIQAALKLQTKRIVPIHWGAYPLSPHAWNAPVQSSYAEAQRLDVELLTPILGEIFSANSPSKHWWQDQNR